MENERYFVAATPPAHSLACLRIDDPVTAAAARLATGVGGLAPHRTGFAPAGRQTEFHDVIASSLPSDQPCLVAPCTNACAGQARSRGTRCRDVIFETLFATPVGIQSHPAKVGRQPEPSDAWAWGDPGREAFTGSPSAA